jgi:hypothetical protein
MNISSQVAHPLTQNTVSITVSDAFAIQSQNENCFVPFGERTIFPRVVDENKFLLLQFYTALSPSLFPTCTLAHSLNFK